MSDEKIVILTHGEDVDGIVSAAEMKMLFNTKVEVILVKHTNQLEVFNRVSKNKNLLCGSNVFILDLIPKDNLFKCDDGISIMDEMVGVANSIIWIDHHSGMGTKELSKYGINYIGNNGKNICTARLIADTFFIEHAKKEYVEILSSIAQINDYPEYDYKSKNNSLKSALRVLGDDLQQSITCLDVDVREKEIVRIVNRIMLDIGWSDYVQEILLEYHERILAAKVILQDSQGECLVENLNFITAYVDPILPQKLILRQMREENKGKVDGCIAFFPAPVNNALFFKDPVRNSFIAEDFCLFMGGGGRDGDGGFSIAHDVFWENFDELIDEFKKSIVKFLNR